MSLIVPLSNDTKTWVKIDGSRLRQPFAVILFGELYLGDGPIRSEEALPSRPEELRLFNPYKLVRAADHDVSLWVTSWSFVESYGRIRRGRMTPTCEALFDLLSESNRVEILEGKAEGLMRKWRDRATARAWAAKLGKAFRGEEAWQLARDNRPAYRLDVRFLVNGKPKFGGNYVHIKYTNLEYVQVVAQEMPEGVSEKELELLKRMAEDGIGPNLVDPFSEEEKSPDYYSASSWSPCELCLNGTHDSAWNVSPRIIEGYHSVSGPGSSYGWWSTDSLDIMYAYAYLVQHS